jgi:queuine tRNA-ribosyltransferase
MFEILCEDGPARVGRLKTRSGVFDTPFYMPVITRADASRTIGPEDYHSLGAHSEDCTEAGHSTAIANALISAFAPGVEALGAGGLRAWLGTPLPLFTDSGGYQTSQGTSFDVRRLANGFEFRARWNGMALHLTPRRSVELQERLGSDVALVLDDMAPYGADAAVLRECVERTHAWAREAVERRSDAQQLLFGICQGGTDPELRRHSAACIDALDFDGIAIGGIGILARRAERLAAVAATLPALSVQRLRYVMGVGDPAQIVELVCAGIDCFDAAYPTIQARAGRLVTSRGTRDFLQPKTLPDGPIESGCVCTLCVRLSFAELVALGRSQPDDAVRLAAMHNLVFLARLMADLRAAIRARRLREFSAQWRARWEADQGS